MSKIPLVISVEEKGIKKIIQFNPEDAIVVEEKYVEKQLIAIYHFLTFKIVITTEDGKIKSANIIDRETCVCMCD